MRTVTDDAGRLGVTERVASLLEGFTLTSVEYLWPAAMDERTRIGGSEFEHAEAGVRLINADGRHRTIRWAQDGFDEGLWFGEEPGPDDDSLWLPDVRTVGVNSWRQLGTGTSIDTATVVWQHIGPSRFSIWSVRLVLDGQSVVVCLGERDCETGRPSYIPDCVLVVFDEHVAKNYHPTASFDSAWGPGGSGSDG